MATPNLELVSLLRDRDGSALRFRSGQRPRDGNPPIRDPDRDPCRNPGRNLANETDVMRNASSLVELLPADTTLAAVVDPHDETIETEITDEMVELALAAMEGEQVWPYGGRCGGDLPVVARPARPSATILRFPGC